MREEKAQKAAAGASDPAKKSQKTKTPPLGFFGLVSVVAALFLVPFIWHAINTNRFIHERKVDFSEYRDKMFPLYHDLWISVASAMALQALKMTLVRVLKPVVEAVRRPKPGETAVME